MLPHGLLRVAAATPSLKVADCRFNALAICDLLRQAQSDHVGVLVFPELCLTGYTCADLFQHDVLLHGALAALESVRRATETQFTGITLVGLPLGLDDQVFNVAAVLHKGRILGIVPKSFLPNYKEFYERRWFSAAATARSCFVRLGDHDVPFGNDLLFRANNVDGLTIGVEICEDLWVPIPPSSAQALCGATVLCNLSASNELIGKANYRRQLVSNQSGRCMAAYIYASCGVGESTTDVVFGGHNLIAENGSLVGESKRFARQPELTVHDVDLDRLRVDRLRTNSFGDASLYMGVRRNYRLVLFSLDTPSTPSLPLRRHVDAHPFVPRADAELNDRCEEIFHTQVAGLAKRLEHAGIKKVSIGVSGGLDSTLALIVACKTFNALNLPPAHIQALTMPGYGTTKETKSNAIDLMRQLQVTAREIDIRALCLEEWRRLGYKPFGLELAGLDPDSLQEMVSQLPANNRNDLVFENVQARVRTNLLMNTAFVIGTGDVSELALGWCTYNADHMSMYNPNSSIPKTLVKFLVGWAARHQFEGETRQTLLKIAETPPTPELLPTGTKGEIVQSTEGSIGPYELHDFFLYHFLRFGMPPEKILFFASQAFSAKYSPEQIRRWLKVFVTRFFSQQFKRSCLPDGPKVGSISLSPRGDWRMPSDASSALWLEWAASN